MPKPKGQPLKIAMYVHNLDAVPAKEMIMAHADIASRIAAGMTRRGHEVTFFAPKGSQVKAKLVTFDMPSLRASKARKYYLGLPMLPRIKFKRFYENEMLAKVGQHMQQNAGRFDLLHLHSVELTAHLSKQLDLPVVYTAHDPVDRQMQEMIKLYRDQPNFHLVAISDKQRQAAPKAPWLGTVYNGIDLDRYQFNANPTDHLMFAARMNREKGPDLAAAAAKRAGASLKLFGPYQDHGTFDDGGFWDKEVAPLLSKEITYQGYLPSQQLAKQYGRAKAFLAPIRWEEPFGLTAIEAMACGTPVIGFRKGALPEIIVDGVTGFLVDDVDEMAKAIKKVDKINRQDCRDYAAEHFSTEKMVDGYESAYRSLVAS